jgi:hypothetical protein
MHAHDPASTSSAAHVMLTAVVAAVPPEDTCQLALDAWLSICLAVVRTCRDGLKSQGAWLGQVTGHQAAEPTTHGLQHNSKVTTCRCSRACGGCVLASML